VHKLSQLHQKDNEVYLVPGLGIIAALLVERKLCITLLHICLVSFLKVLGQDDIPGQTKKMEAGQAIRLTAELSLEMRCK
jgi:hypothetical protein